MSKPTTSRANAGTEPESDGRHFEGSLEEVERIIERIERGEVGLEESLTQYERGVELIRRCRAILQQAELKVEELTRRMQAGDSAASGTSDEAN